MFRIPSGSLRKHIALRSRSISDTLRPSVVQDFRALVSERMVLTEIITKVMVLSQGALWIHRTMRPSPTSNGSGSATDSPSRVEADIVAQVLALYRTLLDVGSSEIAEARHEAAENGLAQRITATFRRTLPALRIASKWLRAHSRYVSQGQQSGVDSYSGTSEDSESAQNRRKRKSGSGRHGRSDRSAILIPGLDDFWRSYAKFLNALARSFPSDKLPSLNVPLEEDTDLIGFLPLRKYLDRATTIEQAARNEGVRARSRRSAAEQVHPNEEQLMRIADLLEDGKALVDAEAGRQLSLWLIALITIVS